MALVAIAIAAVLLWLRFGGSWSLERCVNSGGTWDYVAQKCRQ